MMTLHERCVERIDAANLRIAEIEAEVKEVRKTRDDAVRILANELGPAEAARQTGMSLSNIKSIRR